MMTQYAWYTLLVAALLGGAHTALIAIEADKAWKELHLKGFGMGLTVDEWAAAQKKCPEIFDEEGFIQALKNFGYDFSFLDDTSKNPKDVQEQKDAVYQQFYAHF